MANIVSRPAWWVSEKLITPEKQYQRRREFLKDVGLVGAGIVATPLLAGVQPKATPKKLYPAKRNPDFSPVWKLTDEIPATTYSNFYEFHPRKDYVARLVGKFITEPWPLEIGGLCDKPLKIDAMELASEMTLEERVYRFRCVEAWSMVVPWTGFLLKQLIDKVQPKAGAKFVKFTSFNRPDQAPGFKLLPEYPWPYTEGLRMDEALHPLTMVVTGIYGKPLPKQSGAPLRIVVPWKYGYKSIKSIVRIDFTADQPKTLWQTLSAVEYPFESNVNPAIPHPRWSQASERFLGTDLVIKTLPFNGYGEQVAKLYPR